MISAVRLHAEDARFLCAKLQGEWQLMASVSELSINSQDTKLLKESFTMHELIPVVRENKNKGESSVKLPLLP